MSGILGLLADAEKLTPDQRNQSVKDGVLPPDLANMISANQQDLNQTQPQSSDGQTISNDVMRQADEALDPKKEIMEKIGLLRDDIGEIQGGIQAGEIKPYVGIPLLEKKIRELSKLEMLIKPPQMPAAMPNMQPGTQIAPPVPSGLNAQAPQPAPQSQGLNALQSNLPQQMAYGGIVNLASGGDFIDKDDEDLDEEEQQAFENSLQNMPMGEGLGSAIMARADTKKPMFSSISEGIRSLMPSMGKKPTAEQSSKGTSDKVFDFILSKEGNYVNHPRDKGGATNMGVTQKTLSAYLGRPASIDDVKNLDRETARDIFHTMYWHPMGADKLDPKIAALAVDTAWGSGQEKAKELLRKHGDDPDSFLQAKENWYRQIVKNDPKQKVFLNGWLNRNNDLGNFVNTSLADGGIIGLATGGHIRHFAFGGTTAEQLNQINKLGEDLDTANTAVQGLESFGSKQRQLIPDYEQKYQDALKNKNDLQQQYEKLMADTGVDKAAFGLYQPSKSLNANPNSPARNPLPIVQAITTQSNSAKPSVSDDLKKQEDQYFKTNYFKNTKDAANTTAGADAYLPGALKDYDTEETASQATQPKSQLDNFIDFLNQSRADLKKSHETDKYMGLLMAGLGTMGGTSQYAGVNFGKGAPLGVQHFADLQRQQAAEKANLDKLQLYGIRSQMSTDLAREFRETPAERKAKLDRLIAKDIRDAELHDATLEESKIKTAGTLKNARQSEFDKRMKDKYPLIGLGQMPKDMQSRYEADVRAFENDPETIRLNKILGADNLAGFKVVK